MSEEKKKQDLPCAVVQDLLPLYVEGLTQAETSAAMDAHFSQCVSCSRALGAQQAQFGAEKAKSGNDQKAVRLLKNIAYKRVLTAALIVVFSLALLLGAFSWITRTELVPAKDITIAGKYRLPDGRIMLAIRAKGLNPRNVCILNPLNVSASRLYSNADSIDGESYDLWEYFARAEASPFLNASSFLYDSLYEASLHGAVTLRRSLWQSWFFPADQRGDTFYLLFDPAHWNQGQFSAIERYIMEENGWDEETVQMNSLYINGTLVWSKSDETRQVTQEEAALLLAAYETQLPNAQEILEQADVPDALNELLQTAGYPTTAPSTETDPEQPRITSTPSPLLTMPLPPQK